MELRWYQSEAVESVWGHVASKPTNPCIVLPTGAGKSLVIGQLAADTVAWGGRALILAHRKELLEQNAEKVKACSPGLDVGVYSAGLNRRDTDHAVVVAGVQSIYTKAKAWAIGHRDIVIVDEAHLIPASGDGMYRQLLGHLTTINPNVRVIGLTATPYRLETGLVYGSDQIFSDVCYEVGVFKLIEEGFLCGLTNKRPQHVADVSKVHVRGGEFVAGELDEALSDDAMVRAACLEVLVWTEDRHSVLIFAGGRKHASKIVEALRAQVGASQVDYLDGETPAMERAAIISRFRQMRTRFLVNIDVLTTGFDAPNVDCVALMRPTMSPGLYYQMTGRGFRLHELKRDCLVLDFGGNVERHGPIDAMDPPHRRKANGATPGEPPTKTCPDCSELVVVGALTCSSCGHEFPPRETWHDTTPADSPILKGKGQPSKREKWTVDSVSYGVHVKALPEGGQSRSLRVTYRCGLQEVSEWICVEHPEGSFPRRKAVQWWNKRCNLPCPNVAWDAWDVGEKARWLAEPTELEVEIGGASKWPRVVGVTLREKPHVTMEQDELEEDWIQ